MNVALVADVEEDFVFGGAEDPVQGEGQLHHAEVGPQVAADRMRVFLGEPLDQGVSDFLRKLGQGALGQRL